MRRFLCTLVLFGLAVAPAQAETRFLAAFDDVPLAPGLSERADTAFAFASEEGRIAETSAAGLGGADAVRAWYTAALPALGWARQDDVTFVRGRERLTLAFAAGSDGALTVRFRLVARPASLALD